MRKPSARRVAVTTALVVGAFSASMSFAAWTSNGGGDARARSLSAVAVTVVGNSGAQDLYPGFAGGDVYFTATNPNPYPVTFTSAAFSAVTSSDTGACPSANVTVLPAASGLSLTVPAGTTANLAIADVVTMVLGAPDGCQAKSFSVALTLAGAQS